MHPAPDDGTDAATFVSTGRLPEPDLVQSILEDAFARVAERERRRGGRLHPGPRRGVAGAVRRLHGERARPGARASVTPSSRSPSRASRSRSCSRWSATRSAPRRHAPALGVNATGLPFNSVMAVELSDSRTMNPMVNAGAIATTSLVPGATAEEKWAHVHDGLSRLRRASPGARRRGVRVGAGDEPAQPRHRPPARELRPRLLRPRRGHRGVHAAVLAAGDGGGPRRDGRHPRRRRREPSHRRARRSPPSTASACSR